MSRKTSSLNIRINSDLKQKIVQEAQQLGMTVTEYVEFVLSETNSVDSVLSDSFMSKIGSMIEKNPTLEEIKNFSLQNHKINNEVLHKIGTSNKNAIILKDEVLEQKLIELLDIMKHEEIRYEKDGKSFIGDAKTPNDVLSMIIHNYHSLIVNKS